MNQTPSPSQDQPNSPTPPPGIPDPINPLTGAKLPAVAPAATVKEITDAEFAAEVLASPTPVLVDFYNNIAAPATSSARPSINSLRTTQANLRL
jgi:hypothetical protein